MRGRLSALLAVAAIASCTPPPAPSIAPPPPKVDPPPAGRSYRSAGAPALVPQLGFAIDRAEPSPDGLLLATTSHDERAVQVWDLDRRIIVAELDGAHGFSESLGWTPDGRFLFARGTRGLTVWDAKTGRRVAEARTGKSTLVDPPAAPDAGRLAGKLPKRECRLLAGKDVAVCPMEDAEGNSVLTFLKPDGGPPLATVPAVRKLRADYRWHEREGALAITCPNGAVRVMATDDAAAPEIQRRAQIRAKATAGAPKEAHVLDTEHGLAVSADGAISVWDWATGARRFQVQVPDEAYAIGWTSNGSRLVAAAPGQGTKAFVIDAQTGAVLRTLDHGHYLASVDVHPKEPLVVTGSRMPMGGAYLPDEKADVRVWDAVTGKLRRKMRGERAQWSPDGKLLAALTYSTADIWEVTSWRRLASVSGTAMYALFNPDNRTMLTPLVDTSYAHPGEYEENGLDVRDARTAKVIFTIPVKTGLVVMSPFGGRLAVEESVSWQENNTSPALDVSIWNMVGHDREMTIPSSFPVDRIDWWREAKVLAAWTRGMIRLTRLSDRRTLWIGADDGPQGKCLAGAFDEAGGFDGDLDGVFATRLGDDLREAAVEPRGAARPHLLLDFFQGR
jgi:WD40 repeat protein